MAKPTSHFAHLMFYSTAKIGEPRINLTVRFGVIGDPVSHSLSPKMHRAAYAALGLDHNYEACLVKREDLGGLQKNFSDFEGLNVTVPHKEAVCAYFALDEFAIRTGAANTLNLRTGQGINTDGWGFVEVIAGLGVERVLVAGAGGTARSIMLALTLAGYRVSLWNRNLARAAALVSELDVPAQVCSSLDIKGQDLVVNATSSSLKGESLPIDWSCREPQTVFCDLYYSSGGTVFAKEARAAGANTIDGRELLVAQGALSFEWWLETEAPREVMRAAVFGNEDRTNNDV
ncbi:MAG: shikimate dehydrogenase [Fimbriimonadaceae bacterium]